MVRFLPPIVVAAVLGLMLAVPDPPAAAAAPLAGAAAPPKQDEQLVEKVRKGIDRGVRYLEAQQTQQGNWETSVALQVLTGMQGGITALVTLALLNCGVRPEDRSVAQALEYLRGIPPAKTYVVGLQTMVFAEARQPKDAPLIQRNADWLVKTARYDAQGRLEGWIYPLDGVKAVPDNSNTQYALLGLYAARHAGAKIDEKMWDDIEKFYTRTQHAESPTSGFWRYVNQEGFVNNPGSFTMTVAGVCGLIIAGMGRDKSKQELNDQTGVAAKCGIYDENSAIAKGMNWIAPKFAFKQGQWYSYNVYGIERLGRLSGQRFIGKTDWYRAGCEYLVGRGRDPGCQQDDGSFSMRGDQIDSGVLGTSFALLFLSKGRSPILISKFAWDELQDRGGAAGIISDTNANGAVCWNRKHNDCRHLVEFASKELFKGAPLAWQVYDPRKQDLGSEDKILDEVAVLLQSPVLYMNGHGRLAFVGIGNEDLTAQEKVLQKYVEEGGFIIAEACCGDREFTASFRALMKRLFPSNAFKPLGPGHAIYQVLPGITPADFPELEGLERGCRTVCVFSPVPLAGYWEESRFVPPDGNHPQGRGQKAFTLARNIIAYATGLEMPKPRLTVKKIFDPGKEIAGPSRSRFQPVQLRVSADPEPAPAAMRNLNGYLRATFRLEVTGDKKTLFPGDENLFKYKFMYVHGRKPIDLSENDVENLRSNLQTGGLLFVDAGCNGPDAWKSFDASFRAACKKLFPGSKLEVIPTTDPLFSAKLNGGTPLTSVRCRRENAQGTGPEAEMRNYAPLLEGIKVDGRWAVVYSKYDIGCALEGHKAADCMGHDKESALRIAAAVALYSLKR